MSGWHGGQVGSESGLGFNGAMASKLQLDREAVATFCRRHHVRRLALFGSVLRDDFSPQSDVDVLVEFEPGHVPGLAFFSMGGSGRGRWYACPGEVGATHDNRVGRRSL